MLPSVKNKLTVGILNKLKQKGPPEPQVPSFDPMGKGSPMVEEQSDEMEDSSEANGSENGDNDQEKLLQVMYPSRKNKKKLPPVGGGPVY